MTNSDFLARLRATVGPEHVLTAPTDIAPYCEDWRGRYRGHALAVVRPASVEEVAQVVHLALDARVAIVPQGGNTGMVGGATPSADATQLVVCLARLNRVRAIDADNATLTVEAGVTLAEVQRAAEQVHLLFPLSVAAEGSCQIGGNLSTNAGGTAVLHYGNTRDLVLGLEVVLPDGRVWSALRGLRKDNTGYDLKQLFIGAEGTLGIITAAVLKLFPRPQIAATALAAVPDAVSAVKLLRHARRTLGYRLVGFELISAVCTALVLRHIPRTHDALPGHPWYCLMQVEDTLADTALPEKVQTTLADAVEQGIVADAIVAQSIAQADALWALRENIAEAQKREGFSVKHDLSLPVSHIPAFLAEAQHSLQSALPGIRIVAFGHLGDGNLHYNMSAASAADNQALLERTPQVNRIVHDLVHAHAGSISAEHGLGQLKREEIKRYKSALELELMRRVKHAFDPLGLFNPGKLLDF